MAPDSRRSADRLKEGGIIRRSKHLTRLLRLDSSHLLVALVVALLVSVMTRARTEGEYSNVAERNDPDYAGEFGGMTRASNKKSFCHYLRRWLR